MPDRKKYIVFDGYGETLGSVRCGIDNIINDPIYEDYDLDKLETMYLPGSASPYRYIVILKLNESVYAKNI